MLLYIDSVFLPNGTILVLAVAKYFQGNFLIP